MQLARSDSRRRNQCDPIPIPWARQSPRLINDEPVEIERDVPETITSLSREKNGRISPFPSAWTTRARLQDELPEPRKSTFQGEAV